MGSLSLIAIFDGLDVLVLIVISVAHTVLIMSELELVRRVDAQELITLVSDHFRTKLRTFCREGA